MSLFSGQLKAPPPSDAGERIANELARLNHNLERYLSHLGIRPTATPAQAALSEVPSLYVGEAASELELALREHAQERGHEWNQTD